MLVDIPDYFFQNNFPLKSIETLFEVHTGVLDNRDAYFYTNENGQKIDLKMFRMSSFDLYKRELKSRPDWEKASFKLAQQRKQKTRETRQGQSENDQQEETSIMPEKVLTIHDYVICTRSYGTKPFTGISLLNTDLQSDQFIVSHHFLVLRPRTDGSPNMNFTFLHLLMDAVLESKAQAQPVSSDGKEGITKRKLEKINVICPPREWQDQFVDFYESLKDTITTITTKLKILDGELSRHS